MGTTKGDDAMRILVTGGAGYLGSVLVPLLLGREHKVTVLETFAYGNDTTMAPYCANGLFDIHRVDCRDIRAMRPHLAKADVVIPLAALVGAPICNLNPLDAEALNLTSQLELIAELSKEQRVINPSTESVYGRNTDLCTESTPVAPLVSYGVQKLYVEDALAERGNAVSLRFATLFGMSPRMRLDLMVNDFTWRALKDRSLVVFEGSAMRTMCHVFDAASAIVHCLGLVKPEHEVYNVGAIAISKVSLCEAIKARVPEFFFTEAQYSADPDARDYRVSQDKLEATGYQHLMSLDMGIKELLMGYRMLSNSRHSNMP